MNTPCGRIDEFYPLTQIDEAMTQADIIILAIALTDETCHLIDKNHLARLKPGAILVNAARGGLVDESALLEALKSGQLAGAALDVFEEEPLSDNSRLWDVPKLRISSHNSFVGTRNHLRLLECIIANLSHWSASYEQ